MKKGIVIGLLTVASVTLIGCQQQQPATPAAPQKETSTATIKITEPTNTTTTKASLQILGTQETSASMMEDKSPAMKDTSAMMEATMQKTGSMVTGTMETK